MRKKVVASFLIVVIILPLIMLIYTNQMAKNFMVVENLYGDNSMFETDKYIEGDNTLNPDYEGDYLNSYHYKASQLDLSLLKDTTNISIPNSYYQLYINGKRDLIGEIQTYLLICEILMREEINPIDSVSIQPYHIYGTWWNETGMQRDTSKTNFNPYEELLNQYTSKEFSGPFQMHNNYNSIQNPNEYSIRMYGYISNYENANAEERVLRILNNELYGNAVEFKSIISTEYKYAGTEYIENFRNNIKKDFKRPNTEYLPDAMYTTIKKLRDCYNRRDIYTLNTIKNHPLDLLDKNYEKYITYKSNENKSDLYYLYALLLNSSNIKQHIYLDDLKQDDGSKAIMPKLYFDMINNYNTLDIRDLDLYSGWTKQSFVDDAMFGADFMKFRSLRDAKITYKNNLIDFMQKSELNFSSKKLRDSFYKVSEDLNNYELEISLFYGLRSITQGKMIQQGVESAIDQLYEIQLNNFGESEDIDKPIKPDESFMYLPILLRKNSKVYITHNFYCNSETGKCSYHTNGHKATDFISKDENGVKYNPKIISAMSGEIIKYYDMNVLGYTSYGNHIIVKHIVNNEDVYTLYAHMQTISQDLKVGDEIEAGTVLGVEGTTGYSTGPHLHFEMYKLNKGLKRFINYEPLIEKSEVKYE